MQANPGFPPARRAWLAAIMLAHLVLLACWQAAPRRLPEPPQREGELVFVLPPPPPAPQRRREPEAVPSPRKPQAITAPSVAQAVPATPAGAIPAPAAQPAARPAEADPLALPPPAAETTLDRSRRAIAGIDRQLRKESLNKFAVVVQDQGTLARDMSRAYKNEVVLEQTSTLGDGRVMKRFRAGGQEWCEYTNLVGAMGQDPFRDGNKSKVMTCP